MPRNLKARLPAFLPLFLLGGILLVLAGCGDDGGGDGGSVPAGLAPAGSPIFVEATIRPQGELKQNVEEVAQTIGGIGDLGGEIVSKLESEAREEGEPFDFDTEVEPWLGDKAGFFFEAHRGEDDMTGGMALETTDPDAAQAFVEKQSAVEKDPVDDASYEGVEYKVESGEGEALGVVGDFLVLCDSEQIFKDVVDASNGDSLDDEAAYQDAIDAAIEGSLADVYVDVGLLIEQSGEEIDEGVLKAFESAGIEPREATAVASVIPGEDRVEVEISTDLGDQEAPTGDPSELLASLPADSFAAFAVSGFGEQLREAVDQLDKDGIPGTIPAGNLKSGLKEAGIDLDEIVGSLEDAGLFVEGSSESSLGGALVLTTDDPEQASNTVSNIGDLLQGIGAQGVTAVTGRASGFSVRSDDLGSKPLVVVAKDDRIAIGYGRAAALQAALASNAKTLGDTPAFKDAEAALGGTPIGFFVDGPDALRLAESLVPDSDSGFQEARPYLKKIESVALGSSADGDRVTAKLIVGLQK